MNDFSVHRIIGRGGFGEVYGCRKADTGKMYAMKCLDKKRIKMKQGETLALNERIMLSLVSSGVSRRSFVILSFFSVLWRQRLNANGGTSWPLRSHNAACEEKASFGQSNRDRLALRSWSIKKRKRKDAAPAGPTQKPFLASCDSVARPNKTGATRVFIHFRLIV